MVYKIGEIAENIYENDKIIKETIENIVEKEKKIITDYQNLKNFKTNAPIEFIHDIDKLLEERKIYLNYKLQSKEQQLESLFKLLEYINLLEKKNKSLESNKLLFKIKNLEEEIMEFKNFIN